MVNSTPVLEVDVELCELQLNIADVMKEQHKNPHIVVPVDGWEGRQETEMDDGIAETELQASKVQLSLILSTQHK